FVADARISLSEYAVRSEVAADGELVRDGAKEEGNFEDRRARRHRAVVVQGDPVAVHFGSTDTDSAAQRGRVASAPVGGAGASGFAERPPANQAGGGGGDRGADLVRGAGLVPDPHLADRAAQAEGCA